MTIVKKINDENIKQIICSGTSYFDILIFNCYDLETETINKEKLSVAFDNIIDNYSDLLSLGVSLSGYQFIGIILEKNLSLTESYDMKFAYFILSFGFLVSMFGVLISFITIEYLRGCREEEPEFIIAGIQKYKKLFKFGDIILYINCILFTIPINLLIYNSLDYIYGIVYNTSCLIFMCLGIYFHYTVIVCKQQYNLTDDDLNYTFNSDFIGTYYRQCYGESNYKYKRKIYKNC